jgi:hypothetical protein
MSAIDSKFEKQAVTLGITEADVQRTCPTERGEFVIKALLPYQKQAAIRAVSNMIADGNGLYATEAEYVRRNVILDIAIVKAPDWFTKASECYDESLIEYLYEQYIELTESLQAKLKKNHGSGK